MQDNQPFEESGGFLSNLLKAISAEEKRGPKANFKQGAD